MRFCSNEEVNKNMTDVFASVGYSLVIAAVVEGAFKAGKTIANHMKAKAAAKAAAAEVAEDDAQ